jgi:hypothetical protein
LPVRHLAPVINSGGGLAFSCSGDAQKNISRCVGPQRIYFDVKEHLHLRNRTASREKDTGLTGSHSLVMSTRQQA